MGMTLDVHGYDDVDCASRKTKRVKRNGRAHTRVQRRVCSRSWGLWGEKASAPPQLVVAPASSQGDWPGRTRCPLAQTHPVSRETAGATGGERSRRKAGGTMRNERTVVLRSPGLWPWSRWEPGPAEGRVAVCRVFLGPHGRSHLSISCSVWPDLS